MATKPKKASKKTSLIKTKAPKESKSALQLKYKNLYQERFWADPECMRILTDGLREGRDLKVCCESIGVAKPLYDRALKEGYRCLLMKPNERSEDDNLLANFYIECKGAVSEFEQEAITSVIKAAKYGDWKAAAWLLERRMPETYGKRELPPLAAGEDNRAQKIEIQIIDSKTDEAKARLERLEAEAKAEIGKESEEKEVGGVEAAKPL